MNEQNANHSTANANVNGAQAGQNPPQGTTPGTNPGAFPGGPAPAGGWQPEQQPGSQPESGQQPTGFFNSIRRQGISRPTDRVLGGVSGALANYTNLDRTLVRVLFVVGGVLTGVVILLYVAAWMLLPEETDGRIHLEELFRGNFDAAHAGALVLLILGGAIPFSLLNPVALTFGTGLEELIGVGIGLAVLVGIIALIAAKRKRKTPPAPNPPGTTGYSPAAAGTHVPVDATAAATPTMNGATMTSANPSPNTAGSGVPPHAAPNDTVPPQSPPTGSMPPAGQTPPPSGWQQPRPVPPRKPMRPGPGRSLSLAVLGLSILAMAAGLWVVVNRPNVTFPAMAAVTVGALTVILGLGIFIAGLLGRRGGWMTAISILAVLFITLPTMLGTTLLGKKYVTGENADSYALLANDLKVVASQPGKTVAVLGEAQVNLTALQPSDGGKIYDISLAAGSANIYLPTNVPIQLEGGVGLGSRQLDLAKGWRTHTGTPIPATSSQSLHDVTGKPLERTELLNSGTNGFTAGYRENNVMVFPGPDPKIKPVIVRINVGVGDIYVNQPNAQPAWFGVVKNGKFIQDYWIDSRGQEHEPPMPGTESKYVSGDADELEAPILPSVEPTPSPSAS